MTDKILLVKTKSDINYYDYDGFSFGECYQLFDDGANEIDLQKIFGVSDKLELVSGITVVYCRESGHIAAVFRDATIWRYGQYYDVWMFSYYLRANADNIFVIPKEKQDFTINIKDDYLYISDCETSKYINKISTYEFCIAFDDHIIQHGLKKAGEDKEKLLKLFEDVFEKNYQTKKSEPIAERLLEIDPEFKDTELYAGFLMYSGKLTEALKIYTRLYDKKPSDRLLVRMAVCNLDLGFKTEMMTLLSKVKNKSEMEAFGIDYEWLKKTMPYISNSEYIDEREVLKYSVSLPFGDMPLPDTVKVDGVKKYFDPVRKKGVPITPEEKVRQQVIRYLIDVCRIPAEYITSEDSLAHYNKGTILRADITVNVSGRTLLLIECKENNIIIDGNPLRQILEYNQTINSRYLLLTNGINSYIYKTGDDHSLEPLTELPDFEGMCRLEGISAPVSRMVSKRPDVSTFTGEVINHYRADNRYLGINTPDNLAPVILNLTWFFLDSSYKMEGIEGYGIKVLKDLGAVTTIVTNASGGSYDGQYRQFLVRDRFGEEQLLCFSVFGTWGDETKGGYTSLVSGIEIDGIMISKLQIRLDVCLKAVGGGKYQIEHSGIRSRKTIESMLGYVREICPQLINHRRIYLGELDNSQNITIDSHGARDFMARLISYVILRKELAQKEAMEKELLK